MKKSIFLLVLIALFSSLQSCEEVVNIPLDTAPPRLVIEAAINWKKGTSGNVQRIKLTRTANFYTNVIPTVSGATVSVKNSSNFVFNFNEIGATGVYECTNFVPVINGTYTMNIVVDGQNYTASETLKSVAPITTIVQEEQAAFGSTTLKIKGLYLDPAGEDNFYLYKFKLSNKPDPIYNTDEDKLFQGNPFFSLIFNDEIKPGGTVEITHSGISKAYFNYMSILLSVAGSNVGGPFQSPPATVKGNIKNTTNLDNFPLGYFSVSEIDSKIYVIQ